jgi:hypothetical protein
MCSGYKNAAAEYWVKARVFPKQFKSPYESV